MNPALVRLLQLSSPALPVGAYSYSQGLEWAAESGAVTDEASAELWIGDCMRFGFARFEAVYVAHMLAAWGREDMTRLAELEADFIAGRESAELRAETLQMGHSLAKLIRDLPGSADALLENFPNPSFSLAWSCAARTWNIAAEDAVAGYLWAWAENQVMAALKAIPLGQTAGQRLLFVIGARAAELATEVVAMPLESTHNFLPAFAIASSLHETQYSRIFRS